MIAVVIRHRWKKTFAGFCLDQYRRGYSSAHDHYCRCYPTVFEATPSLSPIHHHGRRIRQNMLASTFVTAVVAFTNQLSDASFRRSCREGYVVVIRIVAPSPPNSPFRPSR